MFVINVQKLGARSGCEGLAMKAATFLYQILQTVAVYLSDSPAPLHKRIRTLVHQ